MLQVTFVKISIQDRAQDLLDRFSVEAAVQDLREGRLYKVSTGDLHGKIFVRDLKIRSLIKLAINDLRARLYFPHRASVQELYQRFHGKISVQDLYKRSLGKISVQALYTSSPGKTSGRCLLAISAQGVSKSPLYKISTGCLRGKISSQAPRN